MRTHDESTAQTTEFDTTREVITGRYVPALSVGAVIYRATGKPFTYSGRGYIGRHRKEGLS